MGQTDWSPDGRTLAVPTDRGRVLLWDLSDPTEPTVATLRVADERRRATTSAKPVCWPPGKTRPAPATWPVWRLTDGDGDTELVYQVPGLTEGIGGFRVSQFSPRGDILVLSTGTELLEGLGPGILLPDTDPARLADTLCSVRTGPVPDRVWRKTFPDLDYAAPCA